MSPLTQPAFGATMTSTLMDALVDDLPRDRVLGVLPASDGISSTETSYLTVPDRKLRVKNLISKWVRISATLRSSAGGTVYCKVVAKRGANSQQLVELTSTGTVQWANATRQESVQDVSNVGGSVGDLVGQVEWDLEVYLKAASGTCYLDHLVVSNVPNNTDDF